MKEKMIFGKKITRFIVSGLFIIFYSAAKLIWVCNISRAAVTAGSIAVYTAGIAVGAIIIVLELLRQKRLKSAGDALAPVSIIGLPAITVLELTEDLYIHLARANGFISPYRRLDIVFVLVVSIFILNTAALVVFEIVRVSFQKEIVQEKNYKKLIHSLLALDVVLLVILLFINF